MRNRQAYKQAKERLEAKYSFYTHLIVFVAVNLLLATINLTSSDTLWFVYPLFGWSIGLFFHALSVFAGNKLMITDRMVEKELNREGF